MKTIRSTIDTILDELEDSGQSVAVALSDHLRDVMDSFDVEQNDEIKPALICECEEMIHICQSTIKDLSTLIEGAKS